jgi:hypothetical protein
MRRAADIAAKTAGDTASPTVTTLLATAAVVTRSPELALVSVPAGAFAGALTEQGVVWISEALRDRAERVRHFAEAVEDITGGTVEDFVSAHATDEKRRELLGRIVEASTTAQSAWKIKTLARAFVRGARDGDLVDETLMFLQILQDLEAGHARYLAVLHNAPPPKGGYGTRTDSIVGTQVLRRAVVKMDPGLTAAEVFLYRDLKRWDLITIAHTPADIGLTDLGAACAEWLATLGASGG